MNLNLNENNIRFLTLKLLSVSLIAGYFFLGYFFVANLDVAKTFSVNIFIDELIPYTPFFIVFYIFGDVLSLLGMMLVSSKLKLRAAALSYFIMLTLAFIVFWIYPIEIVRPSIPLTGFFNSVVLLRISLDTTRNALPSLHVALGTLSWLIIKGENRKLSNWLMIPTILMIFSTLFVKQHVFLDAVAGIAIASATYFLIYLKMCKQLKTTTD